MTTQERHEKGEGERASVRPDTTDLRPEAGESWSTGS